MEKQVLQIENVTIDELVEKLTNQLRCSLSRPEPEDEWITEKQAADLLQVSRQTLKNWRDAQLIQYNRIGKSIRYSKNEIQTKVKKA
jgi:hypothetical protein